MAKEYKHNFYAGADYGFDSKYNKDFSVGLSSKYSFPTGSFGITTDPRTANQLQAVSNKLNTGAKVVEVTAIQMGVLDMIPKQHLKELERLKKLVGADLTFHGPLVEPSGATQQGWDASLQKKAEREMSSAMERAHELDPKGNIVVTFHSSNGLPMPETVVKVKDENKDSKTYGKMIEKTSNIFVVNEDSGRVGQLPKKEPDFLSGEKEYKPSEELKRFNQENWLTQLSNINLSTQRANRVFTEINSNKENNKLKDLDLEQLYKIHGTEEEQKLMKNLSPEAQRNARNIVEELNFADVQARDSLRMFRDAFNDAYAHAEREAKRGNFANKEKLDELKTKIAPAVSNYTQEGGDRDPAKVQRVTEAITEGIGILKSKDFAPETFKPLKQFAIDKASETFANVAFNSYNKFKDNSPIVSIENPPAGMGLARAEELREVILESRKKFAEKLVEEKGMTKKAADKQAEKLIGATWDVGHINMIRGFGFDEKDVIEESKKIADTVKHVHLSDNFGLEHTELPMGMGNVPTKEIMALNKKFRDAKKIIETGGWFGPQGFGNNTPLMESFRAFDSPIYAMQAGPSWQGYANNRGGYFSGFGRYLPEQHFSIYGAGFSNLPPELGGQMAGRSRASGTPVD